MGKKLLLIRRSDGTTQYLRPVNQPPGGTSAAGVYRTIRATQVRTYLVCYFVMYGFRCSGNIKL